MVRRRGADEAAAYARRRPELAVGLHFELGEWEFRAGAWEAIHQVPAADVGAELASQLEAFRVLMRREPTHLDSHQHAHRREPAREAVMRIGAELGVPVRDFDPRVSYWGGFYGQGDRGEGWPELIAPEALHRIFGYLQDGVTEISCHPGYVDEGLSSYAAERALEVASLCDPDVRRWLAAAEIRLISFHDLEEAASD